MMQANTGGLQHHHHHLQQHHDESGLGQDESGCSSGSSASSPPPLSTSNLDDEQENLESLIFASENWAPQKVKDIAYDREVMEHYIKFAATPCIPGGGCDSEQAFDVLYKFQGDIMQATSYLLSRDTNGQKRNWTLNEKQLFEHAFQRYPKDFCSISRELKTKTVKDCVQYYYLQHYKHHHSQQPTTHKQATIDIKLPQQPNPHHKQQQQQRHLKQEQPDQEEQQVQQEQEQGLVQQAVECFPCKVCGREFAKIKSRSAHMKRHKNERLYG